jgi:hypothetical protein
LAVATVTFIVTGGDIQTTMGVFGATYRGVDAALNGAGWAESLRAAARGYSEGLSIAGGDNRAVVNIFIDNPETGAFSSVDYQQANQGPPLARVIGITLYAAAAEATIIEESTAKKNSSTSIEVNRTVEFTKQIHISHPESGSRIGGGMIFLPMPAGGIMPEGNVGVVGVGVPVASIPWSDALTVSLAKAPDAEKNKKIKKKVEKSKRKEQGRLTPQNEPAPDPLKKGELSGYVDKIAELLEILMHGTGL